MGSHRAKLRFATAIHKILCCLETAFSRRMTMKKKLLVFHLLANEFLRATTTTTAALID